MHEAPSVRELLDAVGRFLTDVAAPKLEGQAGFHARVAANALALVARELDARAEADARACAAYRAVLETDGNIDELNAAMCDAIETGRLDWRDGRLRAALRIAAGDQLAVDQPGYSGLARSAGDIGTPRP